MSLSILDIPLRCPHCKEPLHASTGRTLGEWLVILSPLGVSQGDIERHYQELARVSGKNPVPNDVVWRILNWLAGERRGDPRKLNRIYLEQAELVASEYKDSRKQQDLAAKYPPYSWMLRRNTESWQVGANRFYDARELEREGKVDEAIAEYEFLVKHKLHAADPYIRLRIIYTKQKDYKKAIRICKAAIRAPKSIVAKHYKQKCESWIEKLEKRKER